MHRVVSNWHVRALLLGGLLAAMSLRESGASCAHRDYAVTILPQDEGVASASNPTWPGIVGEENSAPSSPTPAPPCHGMRCGSDPLVPFTVDPPTTLSLRDHWFIPEALGDVSGPTRFLTHLGDPRVRPVLRIEPVLRPPR